MKQLRLANQKSLCATRKVIKAEVLSLHWGNLQLKKPPGTGEPTGNIPGTHTWKENRINEVTHKEYTCFCFMFWDTNIQNLSFWSTYFRSRTVQGSKSVEEQQLSSGIVFIFPQKFTNSNENYKPFMCYKAQSCAEELQFSGQCQAEKHLHIDRTMHIGPGGPCKALSGHHAGCSTHNKLTAVIQQKPLSPSSQPSTQVQLAVNTVSAWMEGTSSPLSASPELSAGHELCYNTKLGQCFWIPI